MTTTLSPALGVIALLAACALPGGGHGATGSTGKTAPLIGQRIVLAQWAKAENRNACAAVALASDGGRRGTARRANFSGGWAVAFDLPGLRSAYGVAGTGLLAADAESARTQAVRLRAQWPLFRALPHLPRRSFAGYGQSGAKPYPADNPAGTGLHSLAYVRIAGQRCTYNVWSRISRAHLETLLDGLRLVPVR
jgi:hypothetical protein